MTDFQIAMFIIVPSTIIVGMLLFLSAGLYKVKKNQMMVIEKRDEFYKICPPGRYFFFPLIYKRRGVYTMTPMEQDIKIIGGKTLTITYQVEDVKTYHYTKESIEFVLNKARDENEEMSKEILESSLKQMGLKYISIREKK